MQSSEFKRSERIGELELKEMHLIGKYIIFMDFLVPFLLRDE